MTLDANSVTIYFGRRKVESNKTEESPCPLKDNNPRITLIPNHRAALTQPLAMDSAESQSTFLVRKVTRRCKRLPANGNVETFRFNAKF